MTKTLNQTSEIKIDKTDKWVKETIKRYGIDTVLKYPWECLFLTQSNQEVKNAGKK
jgi:hypothetical protein